MGSTSFSFFVTAKLKCPITKRKVRQKFTQKERDIETDLDYSINRYYSSTQGRFTGVDPFNIVLEAQEERDPKKGQSKLQAYLSEPQQWNRYSYAINNPLLYVDPTGEAIKLSDDPQERERQMQALRESVGADAASYLYVNQGTNADGSANYFVGINGPVGAFEQVNEVAGELGAAIRNPEVAKLEFVAPGTIVEDDAGARSMIGRGSRYSPGVSPAVTGVFKGVITIKMMDWGKHPDLGYLQGELMSDGKDNMMTPSVMESHEIGHALARMVGYKEGRDRVTSEDSSVRIENKVRNLQNPGGPTRKYHNAPPPP
jgi:RHS repeat-associated protein